MLQTNLEIIKSALVFDDIKSLLDLGCGSFLEYAELIHNLNAFHAVDKYDIISSLDCELRDKLDEKSKIDLYRIDDYTSEIDAHEKIYKFYCGYLVEVLGINPLLEPEFYDIFKFELLELHAYLEVNTNKYDLIVASKVLSHYPKSEHKVVATIIEDSINSLSPKGRLFLRLNGEGYSEHDEGYEQQVRQSGIQHIFDFERIEKLMKRYNVIHGPLKFQEERKMFNKEPYTVNEYVLILGP